MDPFSAFYRCENILFLQARSGSPSGKRSCTNKTAPVGNLRARKDCLSIMSGHFFTQSQLGQRRTASSSSRGSPLDDRKPSLKPKSSEKRSSSSSRHVGLDLLMKAIEEQDEPLVQQSGPFLLLSRLLYFLQLPRLDWIVTFRSLRTTAKCISLSNAKQA